VFFAVAGATIHVHAFRVVGVPALLFCVVRAVGFLVLTPIAARKAGAPAVVQRWAGFGMLPQAGLALALAILFARTFPSLGADAGTLVFGIVATNELLAPILYRSALVRSGEAGRRGVAAETTLAEATLIASGSQRG
jgi:Kef-type K+ transport system membrane component KefB